MTTTDAGAGFFAALEPRVLLSDDHADVPDFANATEIDLTSRAAGAVTTYFADHNTHTGVIEEEDDTDVWSFVAPGDAPVSAMSVVQLDLGELGPAIELRDAQGDVLMSNAGFGGVAFVAPWFSLEAGETYYVVVRTGLLGQWATSPTGSYGLFVCMDVPLGLDGGGDGSNDDAGGSDGGSGGGDEEFPPDDFGDRGDAPHPLFPSVFNGDASIAAGLQSPGDSDTFSFRAPAAGPTRIQVLSDNEDLSATITLLDEGGATRMVSTSALPGAKATLEFHATEGETFTVVIDSPDGATGGYSLGIDASPSLFHYYYPAGFSSPSIEEFVPMVNPNEFPVDYAIYARYEFGAPVEQLATGALAPHSRGGITVTSRRIPGSSLTREGVPYAFEVVASGPIGVNLGHYDFGVTTGDSFTDKLATRWDFPEVRRGQGMRDFIVYYNPSKEAATLHFTLLDEQGVMRRFTRTLEGERRGGINVANDAGIPADGAYGLWIESDLPIVAAHTSYDVANGRGDGRLGQPSAGARAGAFAAISTEPGAETRIALMNATGDAAVVRFTSSAFRGPFAYTLPARSRVTLSPEDLGLPPGVVATLMYTSDVPITAAAMQYRNGDGDDAGAATDAGTSFLIGAAWVNPRAAGTYIERLGLLNPASHAADVTITFLFTDGSTETSSLRLDAGRGLALAIDEHEAIVRRKGGTAFSIRVDSSSPIIAAFSHYDLFLQGGWGSLAAPLGLTVPLESLTG